MSRFFTRISARNCWYPLRHYRKILAGVEGGKVGAFGVGEEAGANEEAKAEGDFEREAGPAAGRHVHRELGVLPVFELAGAHKKVAAVNLSQPHVVAANAEFPLGEAHGRGAVAAAAALVEHERTVFIAQQINSGFGSLGDEDAGRGHGRCGIYTVDYVGTK